VVNARPVSPRRLSTASCAVIAVAVRWYLRYRLSYRDVEELLAERGIEVDHVTMYRWVQTFTPEFIDAARPARHGNGIDGSSTRLTSRSAALPLPRDRSAWPGHLCFALATPRRHRGACVLHPRAEVPTRSGRGHSIGPAS
jgi:hypothetical protein